MIKKVKVQDFVKTNEDKVDIYDLGDGRYQIECPNEGNCDECPIQDDCVDDQCTWMEQQEEGL
jgi:hypothetical protein